MFESFGRGFKMIMAAIKMGWQDKRLLLPAILTVFSNFFFAIMLFFEGKSRVAATAHGAAAHGAATHGAAAAHVRRGLEPVHEQAHRLVGLWLVDHAQRR